MPRPAQPMREQVIAALIPPMSTPMPAAAPMPQLPAPVSANRSDRGLVLIATCRVDRSGRVNAAPLLAALGQQAGDRIDVDVAHGTVVVTASRTGRHQIGARGDIGLPAAVRAMCRIRAGDTVLLAALTSHGILAIHPAATLTGLLDRLHSRLLAPSRISP